MTVPHALCVTHSSGETLGRSVLKQAVRDSLTRPGLLLLRNNSRRQRNDPVCYSLPNLLLPTGACSAESGIRWALSPHRSKSGSMQAHYLNRGMNYSIIPVCFA